MWCLPQYSAELFQRAARIKAIITDVDGVFADGHIVHNDAGVQTKIFHALDGFGVRMAKQAGVLVSIISASASPAIAHRAHELGFDEVHIGSYDKLSGYLRFKSRFGLADAEISYIGDDVPDLPLLEIVGLPVAVANASPTVTTAVPFHTRCKGGAGAVRELVEFILFARGDRDKTLAAMLSNFKKRPRNELG